MSNFYVSEKTISERLHLLTDLAHETIANGTLPASVVVLRPHRLKYACEGYWLLNRAYKDWRIPDGHFTEKPKIAALQCITIVRYQPFFPLTMPVDTADVTQIKCNEIYALIYALGILETSFNPDTPEKIDLWLRILDVISAAKAYTLDPYSADQNFQINRPLQEYDTSIGDINPEDKPIISALISIFELLSTKGDLLRK